MTQAIEGAGGGGCFRAGTQIQLEGGKTISIELLKEGDSVLAFDEEGKLHSAKVEKVHYHDDPQPILGVRYWRGRMRGITPNHWVSNQYSSFVPMGTLTTHDALVDGMGHLRPIIEASIIAYEPVWNLTVETYHTFIADGIRVHNGGHRALHPEIEGAGGGGGGKGGGGRAAIEADDTLQSRAEVGIIDLIGEGEIGGLVDGAKSIFLNDTPLENADDSANFDNVKWESRNGTQSQLPITGIDTFDAISSPVAIGVQLKYDIPYSVTIQNPLANEVTVIIAIPTLMVQDKTTGDTSGTSVTYSIEYSIDGSQHVKVGDFKIDGKTKSRYQKSHTFEVPQGGLRLVRVTRTIEDSTSSSLVNETFFDSFIERVTTILNYPNSALVAVTVSAAQFTSIPRRSYLVDGLYIKVPSNYNAVTRTYSGVWNGTFILATSCNPAWVLYDLLTSERYGLGDYITPAQVDKATLYQIGRYCDEQVPDGKGGTEPRFSINTVISSLSDAYKLVAQVSSVFRGMGFWAGSGVGFMFDAPRDAAMIFNQANVIDGNFAYVGSSRKARHSVALITWNDPEELYKQKIEYVEDPELIEKFGVRKTDMIAFGCTSRAEAHRLGRWILYTEKYESQMVSFKVGIDAAMVMPGEIIKIHDDHRAGKRMGGRAAASTLNSITLDAPVTFTADTGVLLLVRVSEEVTVPAQAGAAETKTTLVERPVLQTGGTHTVLTWTEPLPSLPVPSAIYIVSEPNLVPMTARVISVGQGDIPGTYAIAALEHNETKFGAIEYGYKMEAPNTVAIDINAVAAPINLIVSESKRGIAGTNVMIPVMNISWTGNAQQYELSYRRTDQNSLTDWKMITTSTPSTEIENVTAGTYEIAVVSTNVFGRKSPITSTTFVVTLSDSIPDDVTGLMLREGWVGRNVTVKWFPVPFVTTYRVLVVSGGVTRREVFVTGTQFTYTGETAAIDGGPWRDLTFRVKARKPSGPESVNFADLSVSNAHPELPSFGLTAGYLNFTAKLGIPSDLDYEGVEIWVSDQSGFTPSPSTLAYDGKNTRVVFQVDADGLPLSAKPYYVKARPYDLFGKAGGVFTPEYQVTPVSASLGLGPGEIVGTHIAVGAIKAQNLKSKRHMID